jgi:hypothetical protein
VQPEGLCQLKIPVTPSGIDPAPYLWGKCKRNQSKMINTYMQITDHIPKMNSTSEHFNQFSRNLAGTILLQVVI